MSLTTDDPEKSPRDCSRLRRHHHGGSSRRKSALLIAASSTVASLLALAVILWLTLLRPSSPHFSLLAATATNNASVIVVDAAFTAHNPNAHAAALYDQLQASASYAGATLLGTSEALPPLVQQDQADVVMSASLKSTAASTVDGPALLRMHIKGQLRWKVAAWVSGRHGLEVDCVAVVPLQPPNAQGSSPPCQCATHVSS